MRSLWKNQKKVFKRTYHIKKLVNRRTPVDLNGLNSQTQIICDIDKTYLETKFESLPQLIRVALEQPEEKITVRGASTVMSAARWGLPGSAQKKEPAGLHFVSASPPQMREVLESKLEMDGLDWNSDTFKDQAYNVRMGRMSLLRQHTAYKSTAILEIMQTMAAGSRVWLIGDNAESDPYIYTGLALFQAGQLPAEAYLQYLKIANVEDEILADIEALLQEKSPVTIAGTLIRKVPGAADIRLPPLTDHIFFFENFFEAALALTRQGIIPLHNLSQMARLFHNRHGFSREKIIGYLKGMANGSDPAGAEGTLEEIIKYMSSTPLKAPVRAITLPEPPLLCSDRPAEMLLDRAKEWIEMIHSH